MQNNDRALLGYMGATICATVVIEVIFLTPLVLDVFQNLNDAQLSLFLAAAVTSLLFTLVAVFFGALLPVLIACACARLFRISAPAYFCLCGALTGALLVPVWSIIADRFLPKWGDAETPAFWNWNVASATVAAGLIGGFVFWLIAIRPRVRETKSPAEAGL
jgi:hypothetical protein